MLFRSTKNIITVTNSTYITGTEVCLLLDKITKQAKMGVLITLVLDNARYQKCNLVMDYATKLGIELLFLPTYSPNLNLIERLWKFVKKECLYSKYYEKFEEFQKAISKCLDDAPTKHKQKLESLLTLNFQTFENSQTITV